jgi:hypothetical protein
VYSPDAIIEAVRRFLLALASPEEINRDMEELQTMIASSAHNLREIVEFKSLNDALAQAV